MESLEGKFLAIAVESTKIYSPSKILRYMVITDTLFVVLLLQATAKVKLIPYDVFSQIPIMRSSTASTVHSISHGLSL